MAVNITELQQARARIWQEFRELQDGINERGEETAEEKEKAERMETSMRNLERTIEKETFLQEEERKMAAVAAGHNGNGNSRPVDKWDGILYPNANSRAIPPQEMERRKALAIQGWLMMQKPDLREQITDEHRNAATYFRFDLAQKEISLPIAKDYRAIQNKFHAERRAMSLTTTEGGYTVAEDFSGALETSLLAFGGVRQVATVRRTSTGADLPWPTMNDTSNKGVILNEATSIGSSVDPTFGVVTFKAFKYSSKPLLASNEILVDSSFDLAAEIGTALGTRIGRIQNDHFTTGGGTTLPKGIVVCSGEGKEAASQTAIVADELIDLVHSLDPAYRANARFMLHDTILATIRKLKFVIGSDNVGYVWQGNFQQGVPDRILGYPYTINQSMSSALTIGEKVVLFGDMSKYVIRDVADVRLVRMDERYADLDQVAFIAFMRSDGNLLDAGTDPVKHLTTKKS